MKIVHIVVRNPSTLDYSIPYLCSLRKHYKHAEICVFYCASQRSQFLRNTKYYDKVFNEYDIKQYDYSDFLRLKNPFMIAVWKKLLSFCYYDHVSLGSFLKNPFFLRGKVIKYILAGPRKKLDQWLCTKYVDFKEIINTLNPDLTLFDHRGRVDFIGKEQFADFYKNKKKPVVLIPHAAHVDNETDEFVTFSLDDTAFPSYCDHWSSFKYAKPYLMVQASQREQFSMIGHPGLDSLWLNKTSVNTNKLERKIQDGKLLKFLILSRKFLPEGQIRLDGMDPGILEFDDVVKFFRNIDASLKATGMPYKIIVKPHPSSSYPENVRVLNKVKIKDFEISYEPFFELLDNIDVTITEFSTSIAFSVLANVPTIVLNSPLQDYVHCSWHRLEELYSGLRYFVDDPDKNLTAVVNAVVEDNIVGYINIAKNDDVKHFRKFYEDNASLRALKRTENLLK